MDKGQRTRYLALIKKGILAECVLVMLAAVIVVGRQSLETESQAANNSVLSIENDYIKWVDFSVTNLIKRKKIFQNNTYPVG